MAKTARGLFPLSGTLSGVTFVQSGTYRDHVRRARGTVKAAPVNEVLEQNAKRLPKITALASPLLHCFKEMAGSFIQKGLWQVMMNRMSAAATTSVHDLLHTLEGMELNSAYKSEKILGLLPPMKVTTKDTRVNLQLAPLPKPVFPASLKIDSYRYELYVTWIDAKGRRIEGDVAIPKWIRLEEDAGKLNFNFTKQKWVKHMMMVLKIAAGVKGEPEGSLAGIGMRVVKVAG